MGEIGEMAQLRCLWRLCLNGERGKGNRNIGKWEGKGDGGRTKTGKSVALRDGGHVKGWGVGGKWENGRVLDEKWWGERDGGIGEIGEMEKIGENNTQNIFQNKKHTAKTEK